MNSLYWIRYRHRIVALRNIAHISFEDAQTLLAEDGSGRTVEYKATLKIFFSNETSLILRGQEAKDIWDIFNTQTLNLTRKDDHGEDN